MIETTRWNVIDHLDSREAMFAYLDAAFEDGNHALITTALNDVERANFFEMRATEFGKVTSRENWNKAGSNFDSRKRA